MQGIGILMALNKFAAKLAQRAELIVAAFVIGIVFMLVLPMPVWLLDMLIALSLCISGLIVIVAMYMPGPTAFSTFPAVLLLTTLFRLAISVSTTRLILLEGDAGHIVETFGNFVVGGNLVVGLVIFLILTVVQFIVITKGSERVSEVSARFSLDAMPGKQMSIDSDLRAGILTAEEAKQKRAKLGQESQLHGAMDGAMKFVKGDAIAGICIVAINLIGGISIGIIQRNLDAAESMRVYSILSIGDALIAQIPALLISLGAGVITTRVSKDEEAGKSTNIGRDLVGELFAEPRALLTAAAIMLLFAAIPGMPSMVFVILALALFVAGMVGVLKPLADAQSKLEAEEIERANAGIVDLTNFSATTPFTLRMPEAMRNTPEAEIIRSAVRIMRNGLLERRGIPDLKPIEFEFHTAVPEGRVQFLMAEVPLIDEPIMLGWGATRENLERVTELGFEAHERNIAGSRRRRVWLRLDDEEKLAQTGVPVQRWEHVFSADIEVEMLRNCQMFVGVNEVIRFTRWAERRYPELGKEVIKSVTLPRLTEVVQRLTREGVALRNARLLLETTLDWAPKERDPDVIADYVRLAFKRQLCFEVAREGLIEVILLSPELEDKLRNAMRQTSQGSYLDIDSELEQMFLDRLNELSSNVSTPITPPVLVTAADIRRSVRKLIEEEFFPVPVFAFSELTQHAKVKPVGMIEI
ncbi:type III secretion system export apparatus subunit SctV [Herbaspirillum huttiense F1]|uniref:Type III secretion system export apparatus subunit SctV n=1 Tax=Herbaspirillum huttiense subsp. lycopersici TaxID=3074428 RepID=A0ABU2ET26_9BURK|nr:MULTISPECIES: type III secretion system export apparatus subunit SctV [Herbaspirillum]MDR9851325.1 type III secretion system export apparatus subunit SctV [Herbaspirillum huttiense SE1]MDT0358238.1 type III secretion system export apparatus subunit SctV [Herbaspirillum huttiense F1]